MAPIDTKTVSCDAGGHAHYYYRPSDDIPIGAFTVTLSKDVRNFKLLGTAKGSSNEFTHQVVSKKASEKTFKHDRKEYHWKTFHMKFDQDPGARVEVKLSRRDL
ncbi:hypothetical protein MMC20_001087 [Loxospora ochrophaea]|nr:hypothetical protein [Loxospora ochrophaea]